MNQGRRLTRLNGLVFAYIAYWPGALHEGGGTLQIVIDTPADAAQREALAEISYGRAGSGPFEIYGSTCPTHCPPLFASIEVSHDPTCQCLRPAESLRLDQCLNEFACRHRGKPDAARCHWVYHSNCFKQRRRIRS